jgi:hypothetical protein
LEQGFNVTLFNLQDALSLPDAAHLHLQVGVPLASDFSQQVLTSSPVVRDGMPSASVALFVR